MPQVLEQRIWDHNKLQGTLLKSPFKPFSTERQTHTDDNIANFHTSKPLETSPNDSKPGRAHSKTKLEVQNRRGSLLKRQRLLQSPFKPIRQNYQEYNVSNQFRSKTLTTAATKSRSHDNISRNLKSQAVPKISEALGHSQKQSHRSPFRQLPRQSHRSVPKIPEELGRQQKQTEALGHSQKQTHRSQSHQLPRQSHQSTPRISEELGRGELESEQSPFRQPPLQSHPSVPKIPEELGREQKQSEQSPFRQPPRQSHQSVPKIPEELGREQKQSEQSPFRQLPRQIHQSVPKIPEELGREQKQSEQSPFRQLPAQSHQSVPKLSEALERSQKLIDQGPLHQPSRQSHQSIPTISEGSWRGQKQTHQSPFHQPPRQNHQWADNRPVLSAAASTNKVAHAQSYVHDTKPRTQHTTLSRGLNKKYKYPGWDGREYNKQSKQLFWVRKNVTQQRLDTSGQGKPISNSTNGKLKEILQNRSADKVKSSRQGDHGMKSSSKGPTQAPAGKRHRKRQRVGLKPQRTERPLSTEINVTTDISIAQGLESTRSDISTSFSTKDTGSNIETNRKDDRKTQIRPSESGRTTKETLRNNGHQQHRSKLSTKSVSINIPNSTKKYQISVSYGPKSSVTSGPSSSRGKVSSEFESNTSLRSARTQQATLRTTAKTPTAKRPSTHFTSSAQTTSSGNAHQGSTYQSQNTYLTESSQNSNKLQVPIKSRDGDWQQATLKSKEKMISDNIGQSVLSVMSMKRKSSSHSNIHGGKRGSVSRSPVNKGRAKKLKAPTPANPMFAHKKQKHWLQSQEKELWLSEINGIKIELNDWSKDKPKTKIANEFRDVLPATKGHHSVTHSHENSLAVSSKSDPSQKFSGAFLNSSRSEPLVNDKPNSVITTGNVPKENDAGDSKSALGLKLKPTFPTLEVETPERRSDRGTLMRVTSSSTESGKFTLPKEQKFEGPLYGSGQRLTSTRKTPEVDESDKPAIAQGNIQMKLNFTKPVLRRKGDAEGTTTRKGQNAFSVSHGIKKSTVSASEDTVSNVKLRFLKNTSRKSLPNNNPSINRKSKKMGKEMDFHVSPKNKTGISDGNQKGFPTASVMDVQKTINVKRKEKNGAKFRSQSHNFKLQHKGESRAFQKEEVNRVRTETSRTPETISRHATHPPPLGTKRLPVSNAASKTRAPHGSSTDYSNKSHTIRATVSGRKSQLKLGTVPNGPSEPVTELTGNRKGKTNQRQHRPSKTPRLVSPVVDSSTEGKLRKQGVKHVGVHDTQRFLPATEGNTSADSITFSQTTTLTRSRNAADNEAFRRFNVILNHLSQTPSLTAGPVVKTSARTTVPSVTLHSTFSKSVSENVDNVEANKLFSTNVSLVDKTSQRKKQNRRVFSKQSDIKNTSFSPTKSIVPSSTPQIKIRETTFSEKSKSSVDAVTILETTGSTGTSWTSPINTVAKDNITKKHTGLSKLAFHKKVGKGLKQKTRVIKRVSPQPVPSSTTGGAAGQRHSTTARAASKFDTYTTPKSRRSTTGIDSGNASSLSALPFTKHATKSPERTESPTTTPNNSSTITKAVHTLRLEHSLSASSPAPSTFDSQRNDTPKRVQTLHANILKSSKTTFSSFTLHPFHSKSVTQSKNRNETVRSSHTLMESSTLSSTTTNVTPTSLQRPQRGREANVTTSKRIQVGETSQTAPIATSTTATSQRKDSTVKKHEHPSKKTPVTVLQQPVSDIEPIEKDLFSQHTKETLDLSTTTQEDVSLLRSSKHNNNSFISSTSESLTGYKTTRKEHREMYNVSGQLTYETATTGATGSSEKETQATVPSTTYVRTLRKNVSEQTLAMNTTSQLARSSKSTSSIASASTPTTAIPVSEASITRLNSSTPITDPPVETTGGKNSSTFVRVVTSPKKWILTLPDWLTFPNQFSHFTNTRGTTSAHPQTFTTQKVSSTLSTLSTGHFKTTVGTSSYPQTSTTPKDVRTFPTLGIRKLPLSPKTTQTDIISKSSAGSEATVWRTTGSHSPSNNIKTKATTDSFVTSEARPGESVDIQLAFDRETMFNEIRKSGDHKKDRKGPKVVVPDRGLFVPQFFYKDHNGRFQNGMHVGEADPGSGGPYVSMHSQQMNMETVFNRYWPAILGLTVGTVFLVVALLTSIVCRQQR